jgi:co-chaperonin GroES (HSP10)
MNDYEVKRVSEEERPHRARERQGAEDMAWEPTRNFLIIRPKVSDTLTAGGLLYRPEASVPPSGEAEVVATGPGRYSDAGDKVVPTGYTAGDVVIYPPANAIKHPSLPEDVALLDASLVMAVRR